MAKKLGCTDDEIQEAVQCAYSVGAGVMWAMADRARKDAEQHFRWWDEKSVHRKMRELEQAEQDRNTPS